MVHISLQFDENFNKSKKHNFVFQIDPSSLLRPACARRSWRTGRRTVFRWAPRSPRRGWLFF